MACSGQQGAEVALYPLTPMEVTHKLEALGTVMTPVGTRLSDLENTVTKMASTLAKMIEKLEQKDLLIEVLKNDLAAKEEERQISRDRWLPSRP